MPKFMVDLWLDGYTNPDELEEACEDFIYEQLNFSGSDVKIQNIDKVEANNPLVLGKLLNDALIRVKELEHQLDDATKGYLRMAKERRMRS